MVALPEPLPFWHHCQHLPAIYVHLVGFETARLFMRGLLNRPPSRTAVCAIYSRILLYISPLVFIHGFPRLLP